MTYTWKIEYSVGVGLIDEQHRPIIEILNALEGANGEMDIGEIAKRALEYTGRHFECEESLMREHQYEDFEKHKKQHDNFINMIKAYIPRGSRKNGNGMAKMILTKWFLDHITSSSMDKKLGEFLNRNGVK